MYVKIQRMRMVSIMDKKEFCTELSKRLKAFSQNDIDAALSYYTELIDDKTELEKISEDEAVSSLGNIDKIAKDISIEMIADKKCKSIPIKIVLTVLCALFVSPIWIPVAAVIISLFAALVAVWIALTLSFGASAVGFFVIGVGALISAASLGEIMFGLGAMLITVAFFGLIAVVAGYLGWKLVALSVSWVARLVINLKNKITNK